MFDNFLNSITFQGLIENLIYPIAVVFVGAWIALVINGKIKASRLFPTVLESLRRELRFAMEIHPINKHAAQHLTGAFVYYPVSIAKHLLFDSDLVDKVSGPFLSSLQSYLYEALLLNSLIENAKLVISGGIGLGEGGSANPVREELSKKTVEESNIKHLVTNIQNNIPQSVSWWYSLGLRRRN